MKIELVKETKVDGDVFYFTQVDGKFVDKTLSFSLDKARMMYENVVANMGKYIAIEILETTVLEEAQS